MLMLFRLLPPGVRPEGLRLGALPSIGHSSIWIFVVSGKKVAPALERGAKALENDDTVGPYRQVDVTTLS